MNHLEQLTAEWYEFKGYFVRRNVKVGKRLAGGWDCELDIVAFHPIEKRILHIEPSMDADQWTKREARYQKKFTAGKLHIPKLFEGLDVPDNIEQIALFGYGGRGATPDNFAGGRVLLAKELLAEIANELAKKPFGVDNVPESFPLLRMIQWMLDARNGLGCTPAKPYSVVQPVIAEILPG